MILDILDCLTAPSGVLTPFAPTTVGSNILTTSVIDRIVPMDDGAGECITFFAYCATTVTSAGAATVEIQLLGNATDPTFSSNNVVLADTGAIGKATWVQGYRTQVFKVPRAAIYKYENALNTTGAGPLRYFTINVIIGTATLTAGAFNAWINCDGIQDSISYSAGYTV